jgi:hypothetical protein
VRWGERGASLLLALVVVMLSSTMLVGLLVFTQTSLHTTTSYRDRTDRVQQAEDALSFTTAVMRRPAGLPDNPNGSVQPRTGLLGLDGNPPVVRTDGSMTVTCTPNAGSGAAEDAESYADRSVSCQVVSGSTVVIDANVVFVDLNGTDLGSSVQLLNEHIHG